MKIIRIKAETQDDFDKAEQEGYVYGYYNGQTDICAYVKLGQQGKYRSQPQDNPNTEYKIFYHCQIDLAPTMEILERGGQSAKLLDKTVIIYY